MNLFEICVEKVLQAEGGYTNDPKDKGNWTGGEVNKGQLKGTKYGIAAASYPTLDIKNLTRMDAINIYKRDYWNAMYLDELGDDTLANIMFDAAVQHGVKRAVTFLQKAVGTVPDGVFGPLTLQAVRAKRNSNLALKYMGWRIEFYTTIKTWGNYGKGWMNRVAKLMQTS